MFLISKIQEICFFIYILKKKKFENRKQKLLPNITLIFLKQNPIPKITKS